MIPKIVWPDIFNKGNPFGGVDGVRPIRITFHNSSFTNIDNDEKKALDILIGLAKLDDVDAMSFDGSVSSKIVIDHERADAENIGLKIVNVEGKTVLFSSVSKSFLKPNFIGYLLGVYSYNEEEKYRSIRQEILEAKSHGALHRDIFITTSTFLLSNKEKLKELNICTPRDALKLTGLHLRMKGEFEWISHVTDRMHFITSRQTFYDFLSRGRLPSSWKYTSGLGLHRNRKILLPLGWSVLSRYSRVLQARDEIGRLFYMRNTPSLKDQMQYHFDYLTILFTAALDVQALIINEVYNLRLKDFDCGLRRKIFRKAIKNNSATNNLDILLTSKDDLINIIFDLRNKIHSISLETDFYIPETFPNELLERIYKYNQSNHFGIQRENITVTENRSDPVPSIRYSVDLYNLANNLVDEATNLINSLMQETKVEEFLDSENRSKIQVNPPEDMLPFIQTYMFLA